MKSSPELRALFDKLQLYPLTLVVLFIFHEGRLTYKDIESWLDWSRPTIRKTLKTLFTMGLAEKVHETKFQLTALAETTFQASRLSETWFQHEEESIILILHNLNINYSSSCGNKISATDEVRAYLASKGVFTIIINELAYLTNNDLDVLKSYFETLPVTTAIWRVRNGEAPDKKEEDVAEKYAGGMFSEFIEK